jgi:4-hydroxy-tetrahydrodipicolinate reductase
MKIALIGSGKTGQYLTKNHPQSVISHPEDEVKVFNSSHLPNENELLESDGVIIFTTPHVVPQLIELLINLKKPLPAVWGTTGIDYESSQFQLDIKLKAKNLTWVYGQNFSMGMMVIKKMIQQLRNMSELSPENLKFQLTETHHTKKLDAPSGTALMWNRWLNLPPHLVCPIESIREGDVVGIHQMECQSESESITLTHKAHHRGVFASGAYWSLRQLYCDQQQLIPQGLIKFEDLVDLKTRK